MTAAQAVARTPARLVAHPYTARFGAEVEGLDMRQPLDDALRDELNQLLLDYKVLFFRDQSITRAQQLRFAEAFGGIEGYHMFQAEDQPQVTALDGAKTRTAMWHNDGSWKVRPPKAIVLHGIEVPAVGGDTMWLDCEAAYDALSDELKETVDNLYAIHTISRMGINRDKLASRESDDERAKAARELRRNNPMVAHPLVRSHPETGRLGLFLNTALMSGFVGMSEAESAVLLERLYGAAIRPEHSLRFRWRKDSVAFWDLRNTMHYGVDDYGTQVRRMDRIMIAGDGIPYR